MLVNKFANDFPIWNAQSRKWLCACGDGSHSRAHTHTQNKTMTTTAKTTTTKEMWNVRPRQQQQKIRDRNVRNVPDYEKKKTFYFSTNTHCKHIYFILSQFVRIYQLYSLNRRKLTRKWSIHFISHNSFDV